MSEPIISSLNPDERDIPILAELVIPGQASPAAAALPQAMAASPAHLAPEKMHDLVETLHTILSRELDYAIEGAVYERFHVMMEEAVSSIKERVRAQLEEMLPQLIEAAARQQTEHSAN